MGLGLGARMIHQRLHDPSLSPTEVDFLGALAPVFTELEESAQESMYVEGAARLLRIDRLADISELQSLMEMLERRVTLLSVMRSALSERGVQCESEPRTRLPRCTRSWWLRRATDCPSAASVRSR